MKKIKVQINRPEPTSKEIHSMLNFDAVLAGAKSFAPKPWYTHPKWLKLIGGGIAVVALLAVLFVTLPEKESHVLPDNQTTTEAKLPQRSEVLTDTTASSESVDVKTSDNSSINKNYGDADGNVVLFSKKTSRKKQQGVPFDKYEVSSEKGKTVTTRHNSRIVVPAGLFRKKNNQKVTGKVDLYVREFHDALDIAISGIPMKYDSAGTHHLQSAGMIEVWALQGKDTLEMERGKSMEIQLASSISSKTYNLYYLNPANDSWKYLGKDLVSGSNSKEVLQASEAVAEREYSDAYYLAERAPEPVVPRRKDNTRYRFNIDVDPKEFPELAGFNGMFFEVEKYDTNFTPEFYKMEWNDIQLAPGEAKVNCIATFSLMIDLPAKEVEKLASRKIKYNERGALSVSFRAFPVYDKKDSAAVWALYRTKVEERRKKIEEARLKEEADRQAYLKNATPVQKSSDMVYRTFLAMNFGVYNCDQIYRMAKRTTRKFELYTANGDELGLYDQVRLVDKTANSVIFQHTSSISYNPDNENMLLINRNDGSFAYVKPSEFKAFSSKPSEAKLQVHTQENNFVDANAMKKFLEDL